MDIDHAKRLRAHADMLPQRGLLLEVGTILAAADKIDLLCSEYERLLVQTDVLLDEFAKKIADAILDAPIKR